ncbi:hypothetical protein MKZ24_26890 [Paenibacillus sp. FSL R7-0297]|nr:hypothetical protein [Paenibacillus sp. FSL R5-0912]
MGAWPKLGRFWPHLAVTWPLPGGASRNFAAPAALRSHFMPAS